MPKKKAKKKKQPHFIAFEKTLKKVGQFKKNGVNWSLFEYKKENRGGTMFPDEIFAKRSDDPYEYHRASDLAHSLVMDMKDPSYDKLPKALKEAMWKY